MRRVGVEAFVEPGRAHELLPQLLDELDAGLGAFALSKGLWRVGRLQVRFLGIVRAQPADVPHPIDVVLVRASQQVGHMADVIASLDA